MNMMQGQTRQRMPLLVVALLVVALLVAACGGGAAEGDYQSQAAPADETMKLAIMAPTTGDAASVGTEQLNFARIAVEQFNAEHGTNIELVESDTELDPATAVPGAQRLAEDPHVYAVIGPAGSQVVEAVAPVLEEASLPMISPSATSPDLTDQGYSSLFRVVPRDDVQGPTAAHFMIDQLDAEHVWIIDDQSSYATGLADEVESILEEHDITLTRESVSQEESDFSALVTRIASDDPDVIFLPWQVASQGALLARQLDEQDVDATIFGADGLFFVEDFIVSAAGSADGSYVSFFAPDVTTLEDAEPIVATYQEQHGDIGPFGAPAYAAAMVAMEAMQRAHEQGDLSRERVRAEIAATNQANSLLGIPVAFDEKGDIVGASFFLYTVQDEQFMPVDYTPRNSAMVSDK
jgi:branched-chain amino acid transport system substrate-binding protein